MLDIRMSKGDRSRSKRTTFIVILLLILSFCISDTKSMCAFVIFRDFFLCSASLALDSDYVASWTSWWCVELLPCFCHTSQKWICWYICRSVIFYEQSRVAPFRWAYKIFVIFLSLLCICVLLGSLRFRIV